MQRQRLWLHRANSFSIRRPIGTRSFNLELLLLLLLLPILMHAYMDVCVFFCFCFIVMYFSLIIWCVFSLVYGCCSAHAHTGDWHTHATCAKRKFRTFRPKFELYSKYRLSPLCREPRWTNRNEENRNEIKRLHAHTHVGLKAHNRNTQTNWKKMSQNKWYESTHARTNSIFWNKKKDVCHSLRQIHVRNA